MSGLVLPLAVVLSPGVLRTILSSADTYKYPNVDRKSSAGDEVAVAAAATATTAACDCDFSELPFAVFSCFSGLGLVLLDGVSVTARRAWARGGTRARASTCCDKGEVKEKCKGRYRGRSEVHSW